MIKIATLVGCAIGDALGNPFEMKPAASPLLQCWDGLFKAGGTFWRGEAGQYTDDTLMSIALASSLIEKSGFEAEHVASQYLAWYESGNTRGIGTTTAGAMVNLKLGAAWNESGLTKSVDGLPAGGNGTAMRAAPIGLFYQKDIETLLKVALLDASITHNSHEPKMGSVAVALATAFLANGTHSQVGVLEEVKEIIADSEVKEKLIKIRPFSLGQASRISGITPAAISILMVNLKKRGYWQSQVFACVKCLPGQRNLKYWRT